jgi:hypothetical protein
MTSTFEALESLTTPEPLQGSEPQIVLSLKDGSPNEWQSDEIALALWRFFSEDEGRNAVQLSVAGRSLGYLNRENFFRAGSETRLGEAQLAAVPGLSTNYHFIKLKCPFKGCTAPLVLKAYYDYRSPPVCPLHPEVALEVA